MFGRYSHSSDEMRRFQHEMNRLFDTAFSGQTSRAQGFPAANLWVDQDKIVLTAELPGFDVQQLSISVLGDTLTLSGERQAEQLPEGARYHRQERGHGCFTRTFKLPYHVDADKVEAVFEKGVLRINLVRSETDKPRKINVKAG